MTVSRVINRHGSVSEEKRRRVEQAIALLGYVPNRAARELAAARHSRIALVHDNPSANWLSEVLVACLEQASRSDAELLLERCDDRADVKTLVDHLIAHRVDGVILPTPLCDDAKVLAAVVDAGLPMVQIAPGSPAQGADAVGIDEYRAAFDMTLHLVGKGHRRIGFITGNPDQTCNALRLAGYEAALAEAGIAPDARLIAGGDYSYRSGLAAAEQLLGREDRPTALFASNDDMAAATVATANRMGLDVPGDLSVCGFDDTAIATMIWPQLSTVRQPIGAIASHATLLLIDAIRCKQEDQPRAVQHMILPYEIVERDSVKPLPGQG